MILKIRHFLKVCKQEVGVISSINKDDLTHREKYFL